MPAISVVEMFGPTIQGEGPHAGRVCAFLRLGGCNLSCSWCDTPYSWDGQRYDLRKEIKQLTVDQIMDRLPVAPTVVITGGEPLLHQANPWWIPLLKRLVAEYDEIHLETNGTIPLAPTTWSYFRHISVSPKLGNAGNHRGNQNPKVWTGWRSVPQAIFKYVVETEQDVITAIGIAASLGIAKDRVWVMPQGATRAELDGLWPSVAAWATTYGVSTTHRLHVLAWGHDRGH